MLPLLTVLCYVSLTRTVGIHPTLSGYAKLTPKGEPRLNFIQVPYPLISATYEDIC